MKKNFWDPSQGLYGLYNVWSFRKSAAIFASGVGGGSLVYANVLIRKPEDWLAIISTERKELLRIISARKATRKERGIYEQG